MQKCAFICWYRLAVILIKNEYVWAKVILCEACFKRTRKVEL